MNILKNFRYNFSKSSEGAFEERIRELNEKLRRKEEQIESLQKTLHQSVRTSQDEVKYQIIGKGFTVKSVIAELN